MDPPDLGAGGRQPQPAHRYLLCRDVVQFAGRFTEEMMVIGRVGVRKGCRLRLHQFTEAGLLKIRDNEYLFNVVEDPRERANLKERQRAIFARLTAEWAAWNAAMLPEIADSFGESFTAAAYADHIGL